MGLTSGTFTTKVVAGVRAMRYARTMLYTMRIRLALCFRMAA